MPPADRPMRPDALHVGFSKCASTFLQAFFAEHPGIFLVNQSHYLAPFDFSPWPDGRDAYVGLFAGAAPGQVAIESDEHILLPIFHPVLGAAATTLDAVREVSRRISSIQPQAKIVIVVRNQTGLIVSRYSEYILCGGTADFPEFVSEFLECSRDGVNYYQNYYFSILKIFQGAFSQGNVLLLLQEELATDESATIAKLSRFLGVEARRPGQRGIISRRVGLSQRGIGVMRSINRALVTRPKQSFHEAEVRIPHLLYKVLQRGFRVADYYLPVAFKRDKNAILGAALKQRIRDEFRDDNAALADYLGTDLAPSGY